MVPLSHGLTRAKMERLIKGAMGEIEADLIVTNGKVVKGDPELLERIELVRRNDRIIHGHTAGARDRKLCAIAACGGIFSDRPWREVGGALARIQKRLREMGLLFDKPIFPLVFLPFVALSALRITARGLVNAKQRKIVSLFAD